jgi:hypothetical protein
MTLTKVKVLGIALLAAALVAPAAHAAAGSTSGQPPATQAAPAPATLPLVPATVAAYATVTAAGTLVPGQSKNILKATALGPIGAYQINTALLSVARCTFAVTSAFPGNSGTPPPIFSGVTGRSSTVNDVFVQTYNSAGAPTQESFMLQIFC